MSSSNYSNDEFNLEFLNDSHYPMAPFDSDQIGTNQMSSNQMDSNPLNSNSLNSNQMNSNQMNSNQLSSNQLNSNQLNANQLNSNQLNANQLNSNQPNQFNDSQLSQADPNHLNQNPLSHNSLNQLTSSNAQINQSTFIGYATPISRAGYDPAFQQPAYSMFDMPAMPSIETDQFRDLFEDNDDNWMDQANQNGSYNYNELDRLFDKNLP